jgi:hypothetical protein
MRGYLMSTAVAVALFGSGAANAQKAKAPVRKAATVVATPVPKVVPSVFYDFKGARLGMTLEEWKALEMPPMSDMSYASKTRGPMGRYCSTDKQPDGKPMTAFYTSTVEKSLGVVECAYGQFNQITSSYVSFDEAYIKIGSFITDQVTYKFLDGKLYEINIGGSDNLLSEVMDGLTAKWGPPTSVINDTTQNRAGATFPHTVKVWLNPVASIRVESPWTKINNMNVTYSDLAALARISEADRKANPSADKM